MSILSKMGFGIGSAVRAYKEAVSGGQRNAAVRPTMFDAVARGGRWKGGNFGDQEAAQRRAIMNSWVYAVINFKARELSAGEMHIYPYGLKDDAKYYPNHPIEMIFNTPNPIMGRTYFWQYTQWWMDLAGEAIWFMAPDAFGNLAEVWPLPANRVDVVPGDKERLIDYYEYQPEGGAIYRIDPRYIVHHKYPNPFDPFRGLSPLVAALLPSDADSAMAFWNGKFFGSDNVMPSAIISIGSGSPEYQIEPGDMEAIKNDLQDEYGASQRKTAIVNANQMAAVLLGWNAKDMDFMAGRKFSKSEIYEIYGVPTGLVDSSATEASATVSDNVYKEKTQWPTMCLYAENLTSWMGTYYQPAVVEARFKDIRPVNRQMALQEAAAAMTDMLIDERRERFWGLPPLPDGKGKRLPNEMQTMQPEGALPGHGSEYVPQVPGLPRPQNAVVDDAKGDLRLWKNKSMRAIKSGGAALVEFTSASISEEMQTAIKAGLELAENKDDVWSVFDLAVKGIIRSWRPWSGFEEALIGAVLSALNDQARRIVANATDYPELETEEFWEDERVRMIAAIQPVLADLASTGVQRVQSTLGASAGVSWDLTNERARQWAADYAGELVTQVTDTTRNAVGREVSNWISSAETQDDLTKRLMNLKDDAGNQLFDRTRAERIGTSEATTVYAEANTQAWHEAGYTRAAFKPKAHIGCRCYVQPWKMKDGTKVIVWYTARDERVCTRPIVTPWGTVEGCKALHRVVVSEGEHLGERIER